METITLKSGAKLGLQIAKLRESRTLMQKVAQEVKKAGLELKPEMLEEDLTSLFDGLLQLIGSEELFQCVLECAKTCTYDMGNGALKIEHGTFEPAIARKDLVPVAMEVMKLNILPFFEGVDWQSYLPKKTEPVESPK